MIKIFEQLLTPTIITTLIGAIVTYLQKRKEEYRRYIFERKEKEFDELLKIQKSLLESDLTDIEIVKKYLSEISFHINPYGKSIKTYGLYQWIEDDGYIWNQIEKINKKLEKRESVLMEDIEELCHRLEISKRLFNVEHDNKITFKLFYPKLFNILSKGMLILLNIFIFICLLPIDMLSAFYVSMAMVMFFLSLSSTIRSDKERATTFLLATIFLSIWDSIGLSSIMVYVKEHTTKLFGVDISSILHNVSGERINVISLFVAFLLFFMCMFLLGVESHLFGKTEVGKVSVIYKEEYKELQLQANKKGLVVRLGERWNKLFSNRNENS